MHSLVTQPDGGLIMTVRARTLKKLDISASLGTGDNVVGFFGQRKKEIDPRQIVEDLSDQNRQVQWFA